MTVLLAAAVNVSPSSWRQRLRIADPTATRLLLIRTSPTAFRQSRVRGRIGECPWACLSPAQKGFMA